MQNTDCRQYIGKNTDFFIKQKIGNLQLYKSVIFSDEGSDVY